MLAKIGGCIDRRPVRPRTQALRLNRPLAIPPALGEMELQRHIDGCSRTETHAASDAICFLGGGAYDHFQFRVWWMPSLGRGELLHRLHSLPGAEAQPGNTPGNLRVSDADLPVDGDGGWPTPRSYEGGSSVAEAVLMALGVTGTNWRRSAGCRERSPRVSADAGHLRCQPELPEGRVLPTPDGFLNPDDLKQAFNDQNGFAIVQSPNFLGILKRCRRLGRSARKVGAVFIASFDPISAGILKRPADYGADIAVAEGQGLGNAAWGMVVPIWGYPRLPKRLGLSPQDPRQDWSGKPPTVTANGAGC